MVMPVQQTPNSGGDPSGLDPSVLAAIQQNLLQNNQDQQVPEGGDAPDDSQYQGQPQPQQDYGTPQAPQADLAQQQLAMQRQYEQMMLAQQLQQQQAVNDQYEEALVRQYVEEQFPEEQWDQAWETYQYQKQMQKAYQQAQSQTYQMQTAYRQMENAITPLIKEQVIQRVSQNAGIPKELLMLAETPKEMQQIIKAVHMYRKSNNFEQRKAHGNDRPAQSSQQSGGRPTNEALKTKLAGTGKLEDYIRQAYLS